MSYFYPLSKVAVGYNNIGGLVAWESIVAGGVRFFAPVLYGSFDPGVFNTQTNGRLYISGWKSSDILWPAIDQHNVYYEIATLCAGGYDAEITIQCRTESPTAWPIYNAVLRLPKLPDARKQSGAFTAYKGRLNRMVLIG